MTAINNEIYLLTGLPSLTNTSCRFYDFTRLQPFFSFAKRNLREPEYSLNIIRTFKSLALHFEDKLTTIIIRNENKKELFEDYN